MLWLLATIDAAFVGYREAAGRNALIDKRGYFRKAMLQGVLFGQATVFIVIAVALLALAFSASRGKTIAQFEAAGLRMLTVFVPYAFVLFVAFLFRLVPSVDIRSITSVLIFGPFTLIRPIVITAGIAWGVFYAPSALMLLFGTLILICTLGLEYAIGKSRSRLDYVIRR